MARKSLVNCLQVIGVTGLSQTTSNVLTASGNSLEMYEFGPADAVRFYLDITAVSGSGTIKFTLNERDPATGSFFASTDKDVVSGTALNGSTGGIFNTTGFTGVTTTPIMDTLDPVYGECYQVAWTLTGFSSVTCSLIADLLLRS
jgi:hypothetical protein